MNRHIIQVKKNQQRTVRPNAHAHFYGLDLKCLPKAHMLKNGLQLVVLLGGGETLGDGA
jgi:hypothetical protein